MHRTNSHALREADVATLAQLTWSERPCLPALVQALTEALRDVDQYTAEHSTETVSLARMVATRLGVTGNELLIIAAVAALHDIGKVGVPVELLLKPGPLTGEEIVTMRTHPVVGERILTGIPELGEIARAIRHEHERWDGRGYPDGLVGEQIPLASRIVLACDAWHAMISDRPYQPPLDPDEALTELREHAGSQFDPDVAWALLDVLKDEVLSPV